MNGQETARNQAIQNKKTQLDRIERMLKWMVVDIMNKTPLRANGPGEKYVIQEMPDMSDILEEK